MNHSDVMRLINDAIKKVFTDYKGLYLYGSTVKNTANRSSDYDIIFLCNKKIQYDNKEEIYRVIGKLEYDFNIFIDIQFLQEEQLCANPFFYEEVVKYGKFYAA